MVERDAVHDGSAPIVATEDDGRDADGFGEGRHVVAGRFVGEGAEFLGGGGAGVSLHVWSDDAEVQGLEGGDLIAPAEGHVGPLERG